MKVGTDGVLLGAWCTVDNGMGRALDIGTGTGLIALMLAQRGEAYGLEIDAVEPDAAALAEATDNIGTSPWSERIKLTGTFVQEFFPSYRYDLIVCNPPYFISSLLPHGESRRMARHDRGLNCAELVAAAARLCKPGGGFAVIIPTEQAGSYITECDFKGLALSRRTDVRTTASAAPKRTLLEFLSGEPATAPRRGELVIQTAPSEYTPQYRELTQEFYLKF